MKITIITNLLLLSNTAFSYNCEMSLLERINKDPNIKIVKLLDSYTCGQSACAVTFEHDSHPYPNLTVLAFLDLKNKLRVNWIPVNGDKVHGHETYEGKKSTYISVSGVGSDKISIDASIETARDAIFWPPHKVYYKETFNCSL